MSLIDLYDNVLIYYPNIFFPVLFLACILGLFFLIKSLVIFGGKIKKITEKVNNGLRKIKIRRLKPRKIQIIKFSLSKTIVGFSKLVIKIKKISLAFVNTSLEYLEQKILKLVKRIGKEILVDKFL